MFLTLALTAEAYYGFYLLLLVAQVALMLVAAIKKKEVLWRVLLGLHAFALAVVLCDMGKTSTPVNEFYVVFALMAYVAVTLVSLTVRTALIRTMGGKTFWTAVWIVPAVAVLIWLIVLL